eukprot:6192353-Pleurochrysis_carterae.AAC.1
MQLLLRECIHGKSARTTTPSILSIPVALAQDQDGVSGAGRRLSRAAVPVRERPSAAPLGASRRQQHSSSTRAADEGSAWPMPVG